MSRIVFSFDVSVGDVLISFLLLLAIGINLYQALPFFPEPLLPDAINGYLPYAQSLLRDKWAFFLDPRSFRTVPMMYIYPALFGANADFVKIGNIVLSCLTVFIMFRLGSVLHSRTAGVLAALLYAASPILAVYKPAVLSEPPYFFFTALWLMAVAEIADGRKAFIPLAGIACGLMVLTRGTYIYFLYATLLVTLILSVKGQKRQLGRHLFAAHALALLFPLAVIIKNWLVFGAASLAAGAGGALYFGSHFLTGGYEAPYYQVGYDIGAVVQGIDHLSREGDKLLAGVALQMLKQHSLSDILDLYLQKTGAFIFMTKAILSDTIWNHRSLRIAEVVLSLVGLRRIRIPPMKWFLAAALPYQILVHIPVLYNPRYSIGAIEIPLIALAGAGAAGLLTAWINRQEALRPACIVLAVLAASIGAGELHRKYSQVLMPDILSEPHVLLHRWSKNDDAPPVTSGVTPLGNGRFRTTEELWTMELPIPDMHLTKDEEIYVYSLNMAAQTSHAWEFCGAAAVYFRNRDESNFSEGKSRYFRIAPDGKPHYYHVSGSYGISPLYPDQGGALRIAGNCPRGTEIELDSVSFSMSRVARYYRYQYLRQLK